MDLAKPLWGKVNNLGGGSSAKKNTMYDGTPQKLNTDFGTLYLLSTDNLLEVSEGQDIYGELVAGGVTYSFVLNLYGEMPYLQWRTVTGPTDFYIGEACGDPTLAYVDAFGGTGFGLMSGAGVDIGDISMTLWTEMGGDKPYYITSLSLDDGKIPYINVSNAKEAYQRDALYYRDNDEHVGKAVGIERSGDGFKAIFFIPQGSALALVSVVVKPDGSTASTRTI